MRNGFSVIFHSSGADEERFVGFCDGLVGSDLCLSRTLTSSFLDDLDINEGGYAERRGPFSAELRSEIPLFRRAH